MRSLLVGLMVLGTTPAALAQQAPVPTDPPPAQSRPVAPAPQAAGETPGMKPMQQPGATGGMSQAPGAAAARPAGDYPICTRERRDNCRQPDGRSIPAPR